MPAEGKKYPVIFYLHGAGGVGTNVWDLTNTALPKKLQRGLWLPFIVISPQCTTTKKYWNAAFDELSLLLDEVSEKFPVDTNRIYITGISMGGYFTWGFANLVSQRIAALAPMSCGGDPALVSKLKTIPSWVFQGELDRLDLVEETSAMVYSMNNAGARVRYTTYPDVGHNCWDKAFETPELYKWFLNFSSGGGTNHLNLDNADSQKFKKWEDSAPPASSGKSVQQHENFKAWYAKLVLNQNGQLRPLNLSNGFTTYLFNRGNPFDQEIFETITWDTSATGWRITPEKSQYKIQKDQTNHSEFRFEFVGDTNKLFPLPERIITTSQNQKVVNVSRFVPAINLEPFAVVRNLPMLKSPVLVDGKWKNNRLPGPIYCKLYSLRGGQTHFETTAKLGYDTNYFYVSFACEEPAIKTMALRVSNHDGSVWEDDSVEVFIDSKFDRAHYFHVIANANGVLLDEKNFNRSWDCFPVVQILKNTKSWEIQLAIPWKDMDMQAPVRGKKIGVELVRSRIQSPMEMTQWPPTFSGNHAPKKFAEVILD